MATGSDSPANRLVTLPGGVPALTLGWEVVRWASKYLRHPNGPRAGERWEFVRSQFDFLLWWYAVDEDGRWLFRHGVRRLSKASGKSPFAALLALAELCAPVRLKDFDPKADGGCVGKPVDMPWVQVAATAESQTANTMRMVRAFAPKGSRVVDEFGLDPGLTRYNRVPAGRLEVITSSATAAEGAEVSAVICDETEWWTPASGGHRLFSTLADNAAKSGSRLLETSNAWVPGADSVAEQTYAGWLAQEEGRTRGSSKVLYDARIAPPDTELADPESLRAGLEFAYGDCWWVDLHPVMERIWAPDALPDESRRKYLNQPTAAEDSWVTPQEWAALADPSLVLADREPVVLFFDGSKSRDATALVACRMEDGAVFTLGVWEPDTRHTAESTVDAAAVDREVRVAFDRLRVVAFFADVREWESFALNEWPERYRDDLIVWAQPTARPAQPVAWDMRSRTLEFAKAAEACHAEIVERKFAHDGHSATARHVANARRRPYRDAVSIGKESPDSPRKIDAAVCVIGARMVRRIVLASGKRWQKRSGRAVFA